MITFNPKKNLNEFKELKNRNFLNDHFKHETEIKTILQFTNCYIFVAICDFKCIIYCFNFIGQIISEGGVKLLLNLFKECSAEGKLKAAHGLVKLGSHCDPNIAFTG